MKHIRKTLMYLPLAIALVSPALTVPVYAHDGSSHDENETTSQTVTSEDADDDNGGSSSGQVEDTSHQEDSTHQTRTRSRGETVTQNVRQEDKTARLNDLHARGQELLQKAREGRQLKTAAEREKICQTRKQGLQNRVSRISTNAARHQTRIKSIYDKAVAYQEDKNLTGSNLDTLQQAALAAGTKSQASVDALKSVQPTIDCNKDSVATDVATFKAAATEARDNLKAYKDAVKAYLKALKDATPSTPTTTTDDSAEGGNQ
jgi:hypothetical protein